MKGYWETTDGLIIHYDKVLLMKDNRGENDNEGFVRVVFVGGVNEENIVGDEDMKVFDAWKAWLDYIHD